jgi:hypothetical protein
VAHFIKESAWADWEKHENPPHVVLYFDKRPQNIFPVYPGSSVSIVSGYMMFWELALLPFSDGIQLYWKIFHSLFSVLVDDIGETGLSLYSVWLRAGQPGDRRSIPGRGEKDFSSSLCVQTGSEAHPASCTMGTGGPFLGAKARPGREADHSPHLVPWSMSRSYTYSSPSVFMACIGTALAFSYKT